MALGSFCKDLGIDEEVLSGQKLLTCEIKSLTNGVMWELKKYKTAKKLTTKDIVDWMTKVFDIKCENTLELQEEINVKFENLATLRGTVLKNPSKYRGEIDRLMNWAFDLPKVMYAEPLPVFEPTIRASLGPKLLKVLKEKGGDDDDSVEMSGPSDDDDEQAKKRKAREEIVQLKKDLGNAKKVITSLNDKMVELSKRCQTLSDLSKTSVSECRRIESDIGKLKSDWGSIITVWHDCMERLNHVNNNKGNYLDIGYMVRRNKTKQGIFDELNFEFEKTVEEFKHKINSLIDKERRKKKVVSREYRQKGKTDRKRVRQESEDNDENKKQCLSEEAMQATPAIMSIDEFMKSEKVDEFKAGKFNNALKAIYQELLSMPFPCNDVHEIVFNALDELENLNTDKIPSQSFAGNILMEVRMLASLQAFTDLLKMSKIYICNDSTTKFNLVETTYDVTLADETHVKLGVRDISTGSPDTSLNVLKDLFSDLMNAKTEGNESLETLVKLIKSFVVDQYLFDKKLMEILFLYKQQMSPVIEASLSSLPEVYQSKVISLNNFCTGIYFLLGLAELSDVTILSWEILSVSGNSTEGKTIETNLILSKTVQQIYSFCKVLDPHAENNDELKVEFKNFVQKEKKLDSTPFAPYKSNFFNTIFHNSAGTWFYHDIGLLSEFIDKAKEKEFDVKPITEILNEKHSFAFARALGLVGKLVAVPLWTVLEDEDIDIGLRYNALLKCVENWSKDASKFMKGQERLFDDVAVSHDAAYISLIKDSESSDVLTKEILELMFTAFVPYIKFFLFGDSTPSENCESAMEVDTDIKVTVHKDFGLFDRITKNIHSAPTFALDALLLYSKTRNGEWQDKLLSKDNVKVFELVQKNATKQLKLLYNRKIKLNEIKDQAKSQTLDEYSKCQLIEKKYKLIDDLIKWGGLWKSEKEIDSQIKDLKDSDQLSALKAQIRFRRHILGEQHDSGLLDLASEGECFNALKLIENLNAVIKKECIETETDIFELASATDDENLKSKIYNSCKSAQELKAVAESGKSSVPKENFHWLLGKLFTHSLITDQVKEDLVGICIARKKVNGVYSYFVRYKSKEGIFKVPDCRISEDFKNQDIKVIEPSVDDLIGSHLSRAFIKDDGDLEWHDCKVIDIIKCGPDFVLEFDFFGSTLQVGDDSNKIPELETLTFTSRLLEDYRTDHLRLL